MPVYRYRSRVNANDPLDYLSVSLALDDEGKAERGLDLGNASFVQTPLKNPIIGATTKVITVQPNRLKIAIWLKMLRLNVRLASSIWAA